MASTSTTYRASAEQVRMLAERATTDQLRDEYLKIADQWEQMATDAEVQERRGSRDRKQNLDNSA
jgi:hypothetical protein